jgi:hypothetical protein
MSAMDSVGLKASVESGPVDLFVRLRQLAAQTPARIATVSPQRTASYRKLWSRVERATARLQGEWGVSAGQCVVYEGPPHADALVLWLAVCRLGACMLPLERIPLPAHADAPAVAHASRGAPVLALASSRATLWVHADGMQPSITQASIAAQPLSALIMRPCPFKPAALHEDGRLDCIEFLTAPALSESQSGQSGKSGQSRRLSLRALMSQYRHPLVHLDPPGPPVALDRGAFNEHVLGPVLLPALMAGCCLLFGTGALPDVQPGAAALR